MVVFILQKFCNINSLSPKLDINIVRSPFKNIFQKYKKSLRADYHGDTLSIQNMYNPHLKHNVTQLQRTPLKIPQIVWYTYYAWLN